MSINEFESSFSKKYKWTSSFMSGLSLAIIDSIIVMCCIGFGFFVVNLVDRSLINFRSFITYSIYLPAIIFVFFAINLYPGIMMSPEEEVRKFCISTFFCFIGIAISVIIESDDKWAISAALALAFPVATIALPCGREIAKSLFARYKWWGVPVVIYSKGNNAKIIIDRLLRNPKIGYRPSIIITDSKKSFSDEYKGIPVFTNSIEVFTAIKRLDIKVAIICDYEEDIDSIMAHYRYTILVPKNQIVSTMSLHMRDFGGILGFSVTHNLTKNWNLLIKRIIDLLLIIISLPLTFPVILILSLLVKLTSKGPVFYGHERVGKNGKHFKTWKFRSMVIDADKRLEEILANDPKRREEWEKDRKFIDDPRVTKVGAFLRKTSLDELPQLFNILVGQMSFVGPRPVTEGELEKYGKYAEYVFSVQPGLSGMWQISGRSDTGYEERITLDSYYIQNWSIWLDIWIIIKTIWVVIKGKGAY